MKVDVFTLCDFANTAPGGKMNILGTYNSVAAYKVPATHRLCALAILMRFEKIEEGTKNIRLSIIDQDGKAVIPTLEAQLMIQIREDVSDATVPLSFVIQQIVFPHFGEYRIDLAVDGRQEASIPLYVRQAPGPKPQLPLPPAK